MASYIVKHSFRIFEQKPIKLWGLSVLCSIICMIITSLGAAIPLITIPIDLVIMAGMHLIYLNGYDGIMPDSEDLFDGFKKDKIGRIAGGMCWYKLWSLIWGFVPIANIVKSLQYSFTPYILMTRPEVSPTKALRCSIEETRGYKLPMFLTNLVISLIVIVVLWIFAALSGISLFFGFILILLLIAMFMFLPLLFGVITAGFYRESQKRASGMSQQAAYSRQNPYYNAPSNGGAQAYEQTVAAEQPSGWMCKQCGKTNPVGTLYCCACGKKKDEAPRNGSTEVQ